MARDAAGNIGSRRLERCRIDPACHHVHALHALTGAIRPGEADRAVNAGCRCGKGSLVGEVGQVGVRNGVQSAQSGAVVHGGLERIGQAGGDVLAGSQVDCVHHGKSGKVGRRGYGPAGPNVQVGLRGSESENAAEHAHHMVFKIYELRRLLCADSVQNHKRVRQGCVAAEVVQAAVSGVVPAVVGTAHPEQGFGDLPVQVVHDAHGSIRGAGLDVRRQAQLSRRHRDVASVHVFR